MSFENFTILRNFGMLIEKSCRRDQLLRMVAIRKITTKNKVKRGSSSKEVHTTNRFNEYTPIGTTCTQALEKLLAKGKINLLRLAKSRSSSVLPGL